MRKPSKLSLKKVWPQKLLPKSLCWTMWNIWTDWNDENQGLGNIGEAQEVTLAPMWRAYLLFPIQVWSWQDVTEVFFKLFKGAAVPLMQLEPIQLSTNSFETFQARALSLLTSSATAFTFLLFQNTLTLCVHIFANVSVGVGVMSMVRAKYKLAYVGHGADGHNSQWWVHCSPSLTLGTLTG